MTTKTQAAKAFANRYGIYSPTTGDYTLDTLALPTSATNSYYERYREQDLKDQAERQRERADRAIADLKAVMRLLGADKHYEDDVEVSFEYADHYYSGYHSAVRVPRRRVTKTALQQFREDVRAVDKAVDASAAIDRLTGGTK